MRFSELFLKFASPGISFFAQTDKRNMKVFFEEVFNKDGWRPNVETEVYDMKINQF